MKFVEPLYPLILFGAPNRLSVMNYAGVYLEIQPSDVAFARDFYKLVNRTEIQATPVKDFDPLVLDQQMAFA
jgi:hypothetical protein